MSFVFSFGLFPLVCNSYALSGYHYLTILYLLLFQVFFIWLLFT